MDQIKDIFTGATFNSGAFWAAVAIVAAGTVLIACIARLIFGKKSTLNRAVSSAIGIIFLYAAAIVMSCAGIGLSDFINTLPLISVSGSSMTLFNFSGAHYTAIASQLLSVVILAFIANLLERLMPKKKNLFAWLFFRILTILGSVVLHLVVVWLFTTYLPEGLVTYAPVILLGLAVLLLLVGALKFIVGAALATVNPVIAAFYTFFFASFVGKALTKAILTTAIISGIVVGLNAVGSAVISIAAASLVAYIPLALVLLLTWYLVGCIM